MIAWVRVVWRDDPEQPCWAPDLPEGVRTIGSHEIPVHLNRALPGGRTRDGRLVPPSEDARTCQGDPMVTHCRVHIDDRDADMMAGYTVPEKDVAEKDILAVRCDAEVVNHLENADAFFDSLNAANAAADRKLIIKDTLLQAVRRGLNPIKAEEIRARLGLSGAIALEGLDAGTTDHEGASAGAGATARKV